jgi:hypothetical protein
LAVQNPDVFERRFGILATGIICLWVATQVFDFSLVPPSFNGLFITKSFCGLHSWNSAYRAWGARSHVKYGLAYTKGYCTLVVGDPPPAQPERYVSHPQLDIYILAAGMLLFGTHDWSVRLIDLMVSTGALVPILLLLRKLYEFRGQYT